MDKFKVICKASGNNWEIYPVGTKVVKQNKFFGLFSITKIVANHIPMDGPVKDEICIVMREYDDAGSHYYVLAGYGEYGYASKYFIKLDEFTETQKEIAEKSQPALS